MMTFNDFKLRFQNVEVEEISPTPVTKPLLSVCVQTYQHESYIAQCLESILMQKTNFDFEILLGEDSSTDGTREICRSFKKKYPDKIKLFLHNPLNKIKVGGIPTGNFNALYNFYTAQGKYIAFCEGDDMWQDPLKLQKQVDFLNNNPEYIFSYHSFQTIDRSGNITISNIEKEQPRADLTSKQLNELDYHPLMLSICFRKENIQFPQEIIEVINVDSFLLSILGNFGPCKYQENIEPALYRYHPHGIWSLKNRRDKLLSKILTYSKLATFNHRHNNLKLKKVFSNKVKMHYKMLTLLQLKNFQFIEGTKSLVKCFL